MLGEEAIEKRRLAGGEKEEGWERGGGGGGKTPMFWVILGRTVDINIVECGGSLPVIRGEEVPECVEDRVANVVATSDWTADLIVPKIVSSERDVVEDVGGVEVMMVDVGLIVVDDRPDSILLF